MEARQNLGREVYIVDGIRTPFIKARGKPSSLSASDLAVMAGRELLGCHPISASDIDEVIIGCMMPSPEEANIARLISLRLGCKKTIPAWTVQRNCASGMQAIDNGMMDIAAGRHDLVLVGGTEAMSRAPLLLNPGMIDWLAGLTTEKKPFAKIKQALQFRPHFLKPVIALLKGLTDPTVNLSMGQTAEILAHRFNISREEMDAFALESHRKVAFAIDNHYFTEVKPAYSFTGQYYSSDDGVRRDTTIEKLGSLKPFFDKQFGIVTAGNSSQVTDGAAMLLLASREAVEKYHLPVLAKIVDVAWAGLEPSEMGLGPIHSSTILLKKHQLSLEDIDYWEINEAFSAQVLACVAAWQDEKYCRENLGLEKPLGMLDMKRLNVDGGAIALGHPIGASGARIVLRLAHILKRENAKRGIASICIGGGQGGTMLIESVSTLED